ncbi:tetratricopeptide repeat protein [Spirosoma panaciterrae]|uniref:tetratricopeptide repeat protein n=1 Tax=Spirosoma panaciterrae TaxID=496058 RepID=UPI000478163A|nr:hypothetical protein [Spirosoma panaciterrae]
MSVVMRTVPKRNRTRWQRHFLAALLGLWVGGLLQTMAQSNSVRPSDYPVYRKMADAKYADGDYERAQSLYKACLALFGYEKDPHSRQQIGRCQQMLDAQKQLERALATKASLDVPLATLKKNLTLNPADVNASRRIADLLEADGDKRLQQKEYSTALSRYIAAYGMVSRKAIVFKAEVTNNREIERTGKPLLPYLAFQEQLRNNVNQPSKVDQYVVLKQKGDEFMQKGDYAMAIQKYKGALSLPNRENDPYLLQKLGEARRAKENQPKTLAQLRQLLAQQPGNKTIQQQLVQQLEQDGDLLMQNTRYADARKRFIEALTYGEKPLLRTKLDEANQKINALRAEALTTALPSKAPVKSVITKTRKRREPITLLGAALVAGTAYALPNLSNQAGSVPGRSGLFPYVGCRLMLFPNSPVSFSSGLHWMPGRFMTTTEPGTQKIETFAYGLAQLPLNLRVQIKLGKNSPVRLVAQGGLSFYRPTSFQYDNWAAGVQTTDMTALNQTIRGSNMALGFELELTDRKRIGIMATYQHIGNLLNADFTDNATNRTAALADVTSWGIELVFKPF